MTKTVAIYARTSRNEEAAGQAIDAQMKECATAAKQMYGEDIEIEIYKDEGIGGKAHGKHAFRSLQRNVKLQPFAAVIVSKLNRIGPTAHAIEAILHLRAEGVDLVVAREGRCFKWNDHRVFSELLMMEHLSRNQSERIKTALAIRRAKQQAANN
jgi:DNA invertase Pin-like site-specific DNA recombinase